MVFDTHKIKNKYYIFVLSLGTEVQIKVSYVFMGCT